jgi:hypothetical protein
MFIRAYLLMTLIYATDCKEHGAAVWYVDMVRAWEYKVNKQKSQGISFA